MTKPEPIRVGVEGIDGFRTQADEKIKKVEVVDLNKLSAHPPFQMFLYEFVSGYGNSNHGLNDDGSLFEIKDDNERALLYLKPIVQPQLDYLLGEYKKWHKAKGYWPNEQPYKKHEGV